MQCERSNACVISVAHGPLSAVAGPRGNPEDTVRLSISMRPKATRLTVCKAMLILLVGVSEVRDPARSRATAIEYMNG